MISSLPADKITSFIIIIIIIFMAAVSFSYKMLFILMKILF